jgi:hypothetical protein
MKFYTHLRYEGWSFYQTIADNTNLSGPLPENRLSSLEVNREGLVTLVCSVFQTARRPRLAKDEVVGRPPA